MKFIQILRSKPKKNHRSNDGLQIVQKKRLPETTHRAIPSAPRRLPPSPHISPFESSHRDISDRPALTQTLSLDHANSVDTQSESTKEVIVDTNKVGRFESRSLTLNVGPEPHLNSANHSPKQGVAHSKLLPVPDTLPRKASFNAQASCEKNLAANSIIIPQISQISLEPTAVGSQAPIHGETTANSGGYMNAHSEKVSLLGEDMPIYTTHSGISRTNTVFLAKGPITKLKRINPAQQPPKGSEFQSVMTPITPMLASAVGLGTPSWNNLSSRLSSGHELTGSASLREARRDQMKESSITANTEVPMVSVQVPDRLSVINEGMSMSPAQITCESPSRNEIQEAKSRFKFLSDAVNESTTETREEMNNLKIKIRSESVFNFSMADAT